MTNTFKTKLEVVKVETVKVSFTVDVDIEGFMKEFDVTLAEAKATIKQDAEDACRASLERLGYLIQMGAK